MISIGCAGLPEVRPEGLIQRFARLELRLLDGGRAIEMSKRRRGLEEGKGRQRNEGEKNKERER